MILRFVVVYRHSHSTSFGSVQVKSVAFACLVLFVRAGVEPSVKTLHRGCMKRGVSESRSELRCGLFIV